MRQVQLIRGCATDAAYQGRATDAAHHGRATITAHQGRATDAMGYPIGGLMPVTGRRCSFSLSDRRQYVVRVTG
jgi:hypothetical protein